MLNCLYIAMIEEHVEKAVKNGNGGHFGIRHPIYTFNTAMCLFQLTHFRLHCVY